MTLLEVEDIEGGAQIMWKVTIERDGGDKPVCVAESIARRYW
jgi:acyl dehydratase